MLIENPNLMISQNAYEKSIIASLFDCKISLDSKNNETLFQTRPGESEAGTGVPKPFFRIKYLANMSKSSELDVQIKRPVKFDFSHTKMRKMQKIVASIQAQIDAKKSDEKLRKPVPVGRKFSVIKSYFGEIGTINFATSQILLKLAAPRQYNFKTYLSSIKIKSKVFQRPEKIELNVDLNNLCVRNENLLLLHPFTVQFKLKIVQEYWKKDPLFHLNVCSNFVRIDFSAISLKNVMFMKNSFLEVLEASDPKIEKSSEELLDSQPLHEFSSQRFLNKTRSKCTVEHYQDDLRAGAFQFLETTSMKDLPLAYQIQIVDQDVGIICWRYPQPRALQKIKIFPVPFQVSF